VVDSNSTSGALHQT